MNQRPHQGNVRRDMTIFALYDSGLYSYKEIASRVTCEGFHCTHRTVYDALKRRIRYQKFYVEISSAFLGFSRIDGMIKPV